MNATAHLEPGLPRDASTEWSAVAVTTRGQSELARCFRAVGGVPARLLIRLITVYQRFVSPALPVVTLGACACRFTPSCSHYAADAVRVHGALRGSWLAVRRLIKCTPLHAGGFDPVPPRRQPVCRVSVRSGFDAASSGSPRDFQGPR